MHYTVHQIQQSILLGIRAFDRDCRSLIQPEHAFVTEPECCTAVGAHSYFVTNAEHAVGSSRIPAGISWPVIFHYTLQ
ncbi:MAG: hypothetical protein OZ916_01650 [Nitrosomonas sp.]|uniref:hypothetical protein n=1 Tax=Nitrosomonas sp. TaxID=42353 RepID=UPI0023EF9B09|nr:MULTISPECIES: hypothetical protein [Nitrosomonas]MEB2330978.1 hypothetical protein [Nitrosomonas sp.]